ncbi:flagellar motor switch protein FliG [Pseudomonas putida]|uniref:Flagellar motor switch protein FliG n=1 Tax=Pseudomonas putida TaxID=303 RepID=A0A8I1EBY4_PSEPU|nr:flagellar motor switch protein FliG [Pseudomonas putida]MBI6882542.1 flagellar motor switch protein FliG [Pseudomonas putida]
MTDTIPFNGVRGGAILLLSLDADSAAEVMKLMSPQSVTAVSQEMAKIGQYNHDELKAVLEQFMVDAERQSVMSVDTNEHLREVLVKALGNERAGNILDEISESQDHPRGVERLNQMEPAMVAEMIRDEHPQVIATILVNLERAQAADVIELFEMNLRNDVILRIATYKGVQKDAMSDLTSVLNNMLDGQSTKRQKLGGIRTAAEILNTMNSAAEESAIGAVRDYNPELAQKIQDEMFLFENILDLDSTAIGLIVAEVPQDDLVVALKGASQDLQDKFINTMSTRGAELFREDMETRGPLRLSQVESQQKKVLEVVRRLAAAGTIVISGGDDAFV